MNSSGTRGIETMADNRFIIFIFTPQAADYMILDDVEGREDTEANWKKLVVAIRGLRSIPSRDPRTTA